MNAAIHSRTLTRHAPLSDLVPLVLSKGADQVGHQSAYVRCSVYAFCQAAKAAALFLQAAQDVEQIKQAAAYTV